MRTEWQSSLTAGDTVKAGLKGNRRHGDMRYLLGKTYWT
ncbi:hypothetical protein JOC94_000732 [Bacillus thermophilus]|uniref:Uncharacterized protein n=1 Tax=Siminovitchia thermophila TaxID=1245522 RepID=A0ABS2R289_9BACI|nr:hypothetical protein [Siminovitchia thermophila]